MCRRSILAATIIGLLAAFPATAQENHRGIRYTDFNEQLFYKDNNSPVLAQLPPGEMVYVNSCQSGRCQVVHLRTRITGYISSRLREWPVATRVPNQPEAGFATATNNLNVRMFPSRQADKLEEWPKGIRFKVDECYEVYCYATTAEGLQGWVSTEGFRKDRVIARPPVNPEILNAPMFRGN